MISVIPAASTDSNDSSSQSCLSRNMSVRHLRKWIRDPLQPPSHSPLSTPFPLAENFRGSYFLFSLARFVVRWGPEDGGPGSERGVWGLHELSCLG